MPALEIDEVLTLIDQVKEQTYSVASKQLIVDLVETAQKDYPHEDAYIYDHLQGAFDETFSSVKKRVQKEKRIRFPAVKEYRLGMTNIKITVTHRGKAEEIYGVDVIYEIEGKKVAGFQHKKADRSEKVNIDEQQLNKIKRLCPACSFYSDRRKRLRKFYPPSIVEEMLNDIQHSESYVRPGCSSLYVIGSPNLGAQGVTSACRLKDFAAKHRKNEGEIFKTIKRESIDEAFVKCIVGYDLRYEPNERGPIDNHYDTIYMDYHLIFDVLLSRLK